MTTIQTSYLRGGSIRKETQQVECLKQFHHHINAAITKQNTKGNRGYYYKSRLECRSTDRKLDTCHSRCFPPLLKNKYINGYIMHPLSYRDGYLLQPHEPVCINSLVNKTTALDQTRPPTPAPLYFGMGKNRASLPFLRLLYYYACTPRTFHINIAYELILTLRGRTFA